MESVRERISCALELPNGTAVVLSASGTDAEYVPLAIARELSLLEQALHSRTSALAHNTSALAH